MILVSLLLLYASTGLIKVDEPNTSSYDTKGGKKSTPWLTLPDYFASSEHIKVAPEDQKGNTIRPHYRWRKGPLFDLPDTIRVPVFVILFRHPDLLALTPARPSRGLYYHPSSEFDLVGIILVFFLSVWNFLTFDFYFSNFFRRYVIWSWKETVNSR